MSQGIRERIIDTYRNEIEAHKLNDRNFATLRAQIDDIERRKAAYEASAETLR